MMGNFIFRVLPAPQGHNFCCSGHVFLLSYDDWFVYCALGRIPICRCFGALASGLYSEQRYKSKDVSLGVLVRFWLASKKFSWIRLAVIHYQTQYRRQPGGTGHKVWQNEWSERACWTPSTRTWWAVSLPHRGIQV
jgi:hypothetical protein